ncbi:hypothetical protein GNF86_14885 [Clostridium perfringens]|jgi:hypothetical protein
MEDKVFIELYKMIIQYGLLKNTSGIFLGEGNIEDSKLFDKKIDDLERDIFNLLDCVCNDNT